MPHASAEIFNLFGGVALALGFALLASRRLTTIVRLAAVQSAAVAAAAAWQARTQQSLVLAMLALALLVGGTALAWALRRRADAPDDAPSAATALIAAGAAVALALLATPAWRVSGLPPLRENVALALATVLVALLMLAMRRARLSQLAGMHTLANGVALAAVVAGAALPAALAVVALFGYVAVGFVLRPAAGAAP